MPLNAEFFEAVRHIQTVVTLNTPVDVVLFKVLTQQQVDSLNTICDAWEKFKGHDNCLDDLAYIMATAYRETGVSLNLAVEEYGMGRGKAYGLPDGPYKHVYYGRGPVQTTWLKNYQVAKTRQSIDYVQYPELMCKPINGCTTMIDGMYNGLFTKIALRTFIKPSVKTSWSTFKDCRTIVNGRDHDVEIATNAVAFQKALALGYDKPTVQTIQANPQLQPQSLGSRIAAWWRRT